MITTPPSVITPPSRPASQILEVLKEQQPYTKGTKRQ